MSLENLEQSVLKWADEKGIFDKGDIQSQILKLVAEVGELADDAAKNRDIRGELGDVIVVAINVSAMAGSSLSECLGMAYDKISKRTGRMEGGVFVKDGNHVG